MVSSWFRENLVALDIDEAAKINKVIAFKKDSELAAAFNRNLLEMEETGVMDGIRYLDHRASLDTLKTSHVSAPLGRSIAATTRMVSSME